MFKCEYCGKEFDNRRSLSGHSNIHTEKGKAERDKRTLEKQKREEKYNKNPKFCKECGEPLSYDKALNKNVFCDSSCSASFNNKKRASKQNKSCNCLNCGESFSIYKNKNKKFCSEKCASEYKHKAKYKDFLENNEKYCRANYSPRAFKNDFLAEQGNKCAICSCRPEHNGKELVFICDHIDGDASNNKRENLRLVCPNCDSQLDTFKSKNKNGARHYYRYKK